MTDNGQRHLAVLAPRKPDRRTEADDARIEDTAHAAEEAVFVQRVIEDTARARCATVADLPLVAEQLLSRLLVIAERRRRQIGAAPVDVRKFGVRP